jgi:hypothetical protein
LRRAFSLAITDCLDGKTATRFVSEAEARKPNDAIAEATRRLAAADAAEALAADKDNARKLREVVDQFMEHAIAIDQAFQTVTKEAVALEEALKQIHSLGCQFPSRAQLDSLGARALLTALQSTPWRREFETISPSQRQSFASLAGQWVDRIIANHIAPVTGELEDVA